MKALSIKQPWAWLIVHGYKPVENRNWNTHFRGEFLIHAGKDFHRAGYDWVRATFPEIPLPPVSDLERGGIVGKANLIDVVTEMDSVWFGDELGFVLKDAATLPFVPLTGKLKFFDVPEHLLQVTIARK